MTEDHAPEPAPAPMDARASSPTALSDSPLAGDAPPVKKPSTRRKVGTRAKAPAVVDNAEDAAVTLPKVRRPRRAKAEPAAEPATAAGSAAKAPMPPQAVVPSPDAPEKSPVPQSQVETRVIPPEALRRLEERSARQFGHAPGPDHPAPAPAAPPSQPAASFPAEPSANDGPQNFPAPGAPVDAAANAPEAAPRFPASSEPPPSRPPVGDGYPRQDRPEARQDRPDYRQDRPERQGQGNFQPQHGRHDRFNRHDRQNRPDRFQGGGGNQGNPPGQGRSQDGQSYRQQPDGQYNRPQDGQYNRPPGRAVLPFAGRPIVPFAGRRRRARRQPRGRTAVR